MRKLYTLLLFFTAFKASATIRYVTPTGTGNGSSWANAMSDIPTAIGLSVLGDQIWVAKGTYYTTTGTDRTIAIKMRNGVEIYGSFDGNETSLSQRNLSNGITSILSGEIGAAGKNDNAYHIISNKNINSSAVLDGFVITGANDDRPVSDTQGLGGGIYNDGNYNSGICSPTFRNCVIIANQATFGGGIFNSGQLGGNSSPILTNCVIAMNHATEGGGAMDNFGLGGTASPVMTNCVLYGNTAALRGGAMYCWGGNNGNASPTLLNCSVVNNEATDGGGIVVANNNSSTGNSGTATPSIKNCIFSGNKVTGTGPQFFIVGTAQFQATYTNISLAGQSSPHAISGSTTGNIDSDPKFLNISLGTGADQKWMTSDDGLTLTTGSGCINSGDNSGASAQDILGNSRIVNQKVDMGAYEFSGGSSITELSTASMILYPNPAADQLFFGKQFENSKVSVVTISGVVVLETTINNGQIRITDLPAGVYMIHMNETFRYFIKN